MIVPDGDPVAGVVRIDRVPQDRLTYVVTAVTALMNWSTKPPEIARMPGESFNVHAPWVIPLHPPVSEEQEEEG